MLSFLCSSVVIVACALLLGVARAQAWVSKRLSLFVLSVADQIKCPEKGLPHLKVFNTPVFGLAALKIEIREQGRK